MVDHAGVVSDVFLAENGVFLPLDSVEEVQKFIDKLENDVDWRNLLVCLRVTHPSFGGKEELIISCIV
jgi:hypothetical protein